MSIIATACLLGAIAVNVYTSRQQETATEWLSHSFAVKLAIARAQVAVEHAEDAAAKRLDAAVFGPLRAEADGLRKLTRDNPRQQHRCDRLEDAIAKGVGDAEAGTPWNGDEIRTSLSEMDVEEDALMWTREAAYRRATFSSTTATYVLDALACGLFLGAAMLFTRQRKKIVEQLALQQSLLESIGDGVVALDPTRRYIVVNPAARKLFPSISASGPVRQDWATAIHAILPDGSRLREEDGPLTRALRGEPSDDMRFVLHSSTGATKVWVSVNARAIRGPEDGILGAVGIFRDVTQEKRQEEELRALTLTDELTGLYNRRGFMLLAEQQTRIAKRAKVAFGLIYADLNGLKTINDTKGHEVGDGAIREAAEVLAKTFRESDIVARLGGDEFVAFVANASSDVAEALVRRLQSAIAHRNEQEGLVYRLSMSTGIAICSPDSSRSLKELLAEADERMYASKVDRRRLLELGGPTPSLMRIVNRGPNR